MNECAWCDSPAVSHFEAAGRRVGLCAKGACQQQLHAFIQQYGWMLKADIGGSSSDPEIAWRINKLRGLATGPKPSKPVANVKRSVTWEQLVGAQLRGENIGAKSFYKSNCRTYDFALFPDNQHAALACKDGTVRRIDLNTGKEAPFLGPGRLDLQRIASGQSPFGAIETQSAALAAIVISDDGQKIAAVAEFGQGSWLHDLANGRCHELWVSSNRLLSFSPDGKSLCAVGSQKLTIFDVASFQPVASVWHELNELVHAAVSADLKTAILGDKFSLHLWDVEKAKKLHTWDMANNRQIGLLALAETGRIAVYAPKTDAIRSFDLIFEEPVSVYDVSNRCVTGTFPSNQGYHSIEDLLTALACSPDGSLAIIATKRGELEVWNLAERKCLYHLTPRLHDINTQRVAFGKDGQSVVAMGWDSLRYWRFDQPLFRPQFASTSVWFCAMKKKKAGPFSFEQLKEMAAAGTIGKDDMVLKQGEQKWMVARDVPGLITKTP